MVDYTFPNTICINHRRCAYSLTELLVAIAIVALVVSLVLPAIQHARAVAARLECANNIRQVGVALHLYHDDYMAFPSGFTSRRTGERYLHMTWLARVLPYIEQGTLWRQTELAYSQNPSPYINPPHVGLATPVAVFGCPLDGRMQVAQQTHNNRVVALTSYVGVLGTNLWTRDGVLFLDSHVRITDILDGSSNTVMVGERPPSTDRWYGWWYTGFGQAGTGSLDMLLGVRELNLGGAYVSYCSKGPYHFQPGRLQNECDAFHYWSLHHGGAHFLCADASVRFLSYSRGDILAVLATRSGGEVAKDDGL